jgi:Protein of unknown function (DUF3300)
MKSSNSPVRRTCRNLLVSSILALLMASAAPGTQAQVIAPAPAYVPLNAVQLDQLVAPIALDPDPLVAQILTASTFPDQVGVSDGWLNQNINLSPDQRANQANTMSWDASVKGLIAFPAVLDSMAKNTEWTKQLGDAYFNQPDDVMNAIQAMRLQAEQAHVLVTTVHERVLIVNDVIEIVPVDAAVVYLPYYNPWHIWGTLFAAYPGYVVLPPPSGVVLTSAVAFEPAVNVGIFAHFDWGFSSWSPAWDSGAVECNHAAYVSQSRTVMNHGHFGGHDAGAFEHGGRGVPGGYRASAHAGTAHSFMNHGSPQHTGFNNHTPGRPGSYRPTAPHSNTANNYHNPGRPNVAHNGQNFHNSPVNHAGIHGSPARPGPARPTPLRTGSNNHCCSVNHSTIGNRPVGSGHTPTRSPSMNRPAGPSNGGRNSLSSGRNNSFNRPMGPSNGGRNPGQGSGRNNGFNRPMGPSNGGRNFGQGGGRNFGQGGSRNFGQGGGRPMGPMARPASTTRPFGGGGSSFGGNHSMGGSRPNPIGRSGGTGMGGGRRR